MTEGDLAYAKRYIAMTDEEILELAADAAALTEDAQVALREEVARRGLQGHELQESVLIAGQQRARSERPRHLRKFVFFLIVNVVIAVLGTAIPETIVGKLLFRPHSLSGVLWKAWTLNIVCAGCLGLAVHRIWKTSAAKWTWVLPSLWFLIRIVPALLSTTNQSVFAANNGTWFQFSGLGCGNGIRPLECKNFFLFTIPFVRAVAYSLGSGISGWMDSRTTNTASSAMPDDLLPRN